MSKEHDTNSKFKKDREKQLERDQKAMPIDELPLEEVKYEEEEQREHNKDKTKKRSSTDTENRSRK